jgi:N-alpha-acetyltransferase 38, NatC auxiliary subunit
MDNSVHINYLQSLLGRNLRIHTTDTRMFVGIFKCTDMVRLLRLIHSADSNSNSSCWAKQDRNIILANTFEYRLPSQTAVQAAAAETASSPDNATGKFKMDMTSRFIGLVVVPGQHITKIELEENPYQMRVQPTVPMMH